MTTKLLFTLHDLNKVNKMLRNNNRIFTIIVYFYEFLNIYLYFYNTNNI